MANEEPANEGGGGVILPIINPGHCDYQQSWRDRSQALDTRHVRVAGADLLEDPTVLVFRCVVLVQYVSLIAYPFT